MLKKSMLGIVTLALIFGLGTAALATNYGDVAGGNWDTDATWEDIDIPGSPGTDGYPSAAGDTAIIDSHSVQANVVIPITDAGGGLVDVQVGGTLSVDPGTDPDQTAPITMSGGTLSWGGNNNSLTFSGDMTFTGGTTTTFSVYARKGGKKISGDLKGSGDVSLTNSHGSGLHYQFGGSSTDNSGFSGDFYTSANAGISHLGGGLGTGTVYMNGRGIVHHVAGDISTSVVVQAGGGYLHADERNSDRTPSGAASSFSGDVTLNGPLTLSAGDDGRTTSLTVDSEITGPNTVTMSGHAKGGARVYLNDPDNTFADLEADLTQTSWYGGSHDLFYVPDVGAMGGGPVVVKNNSERSGAEIASAHNSRLVLQDTGAGDWDLGNSLTLEEGTFHRGIVRFDGLINLSVSDLTLGSDTFGNGIYDIDQTYSGVDFTDWFDYVNTQNDQVPTITVGGGPTPIPEPAGLGLLGLLALSSTLRRRPEGSVSKRALLGLRRRRA